MSFRHFHENFTQQSGDSYSFSCTERDARQFKQKAEGPILRIDSDPGYLEGSHQCDTDSVEQVRFLPSTSLGQWQSGRDLPYRRLMITEISKIFSVKGKEKSASPAWLRKLPHMVKQLELSLYKSAPSLEAYCDLSTLLVRLQQLKEEITVRRHAQTIQQMKFRIDESRNAENSESIMTGRTDESRNECRK